jgi:TetR/AcrR family transcriptional regulator, lmrAB and yxaGH operons repressor
MTTVIKRVKGLAMPRATNSREKMVTSAALLLREDGVARTGFRDVVAHSGAPRGSIGHHFPGGKKELVAEAVRYAGGLSSRAMRTKAETPAEIVALVFGMYRRALFDTEFAAGCPVGAVAQEAYSDPDLRETVRAVFDEWRSVLVDSLLRAGHPEARAAELADVAIASMQGAIMLSRVDGTSDALDRVERQLLALVGGSAEQELE